MRIKVLEQRLRDECIVTGNRYDLAEGDTITVEESLGAYWCKHGWVEDVDGKVKTGERKVRGVSVQPDSSRHATSDTAGG